MAGLPLLGIAKGLESLLLPERPAKRLPVDNKYYNDNFFA